MKPVPAQDGVSITFEAPRALLNQVDALARLDMRSRSSFLRRAIADAVLVPDDRWPGMWRVRNGDCLSDMVNLTRAKDAALYWARPRGLGGGEIVRWDRRETAPRARVSEFSPASVHSPIPVTKTLPAEEGLPA